MAQHQRKLLAGKRSNKTLWAAIVGSGAIHAFFLGSSIISPAPQIKPQTYPVIFAELRHEQPQQAQLQQQQSQQVASEPALLAKQSEPTPKSTSELAPEPVLEKTAVEQVPAPLEPANIESKQSTQPKPKPSSQTDASKTPKKPVTKKEPQPKADSIKEKTALDKTEQSGLAISKDMLSSDPFELEYQQKVLAHLRKTLLAPKHYSGSVRVEIRFSYRQIATDVKVVISSGNPFFDEWAVKAILVANPFPPVPKELGDDYVFRPTLKVGP